MATKSIYSLRHYNIHLCASITNETEHESNTDSNIFNTYTQRNETNQNLTNAQETNSMLLPQPNPMNPLPLILTPWRPSPQLLRLLNEFENKILHDYPHVPCCYCSILMFRSTTQWINYDPNEEYTLTIAFPNISPYLYKTNRDLIKVAICKSCKNQKTRRYPPILSPIPHEINAVPMMHRRYLSPIYIHCSLGRTPGSNFYTTYRFLKGDISLSKNRHTLELHSGTTGAFLNQHEPPNWFHNTLISASSWLKENNPIFQQYKAICDASELRPSDPVPMPLPLARQCLPSPTSTNEPMMPSLVVPNSQFPPEIHDEDYRYYRLMIGFMKMDDTLLPIRYNDPDLEATVFPDLFPTERGHYEDIKETLNVKTSIESYGKYIKLRMLCPDPRFRLHWYWPHWSYLNLEKRRNFQYNFRIINQKNVSRKYHPSKADLIGKSIYTNAPIIDESKTTTMFSNLRTAAPFFHSFLRMFFNLL